MPDPIEVEVVQPPTNARPTRRVADGPDIWRARLAPGSLDEALHRLGLAYERLQLADERGYAQSRACGVTAGTVAAYESAKEECQDLLAEVRRLREAGNV